MLLSFRSQGTTILFLDFLKHPLFYRLLCLSRKNNLISFSLDLNVIAPILPQKLAELLLKKTLMRLLVLSFVNFSLLVGRGKRSGIFLSRESSYSIYKSLTSEAGVLFDYKSHPETFVITPEVSIRNSSHRGGEKMSVLGTGPFTFSLENRILSPARKSTKRIRD